MEQLSVFSIDVEDGVSLAMRDVFGREVPQTDRMVRTTDQILDLLAAAQTKGTFFILGQVAEHFPDLVRRIARAGHEIGVHGFNHLQFFRMTPDEAREELSTAKKLLEDISGQAVQGHRAPAFSVSPETAWALEVIAECGFHYDSSIMPIRSARYGWPGFPVQVTQIRTSDGRELTEVPINPLQWMGKRWPYSGGSYLRLLPLPALKWAFEQQLRKRSSNILYLHPYELDTERYPDYYFQAMSEKPMITRLKMRSMWINRKSVPGKLKTLLRDFHFTTMVDYLDRIKKHENPAVAEVNTRSGQWSMI